MRLGRAFTLSNRPPHHPGLESGNRVTSPTAMQAPHVAPPTCPFCALHCDDLTRASASTPPACGRAKAGLSRWYDMGARPARISGEAAAFADAFTAAQNLLKRAKSPLISGLGADVEGVRAALDLARITNAWFDPAHSAAQAALVSTTQRQGVIRTTFTEVRNRADLVIVLGSEVFADAPRIPERLLAPVSSIDGNDLSERRVLVIGASPGQIKKIGGGPTHGVTLEPVKCPTGEIPRFLQGLAARLTGHAPAAGRSMDAAIEEVAGAIGAARYTAFIWQADAALGPAPTLTTELLFDLIRRLNEKTRAAGLPLGGAHGAASAMAVTTWQTGYPSRIRFVKGKAEYNPVEHAFADVIANARADFVVWVDAFNGLPVPDCGDIPVLLLGGDEADAEQAEVRLPVGLPGLDHDAQVIRGDQVIALTLRRPEGAPAALAPSAGAVLRALGGMDAASELKGWL